MREIKDVAALVDDAVGSCAGVVQHYPARPLLQSLGAAIAGSGALSHVRAVPSRRIDVAIGIAHDDDARAVTAAVARAVRAVLPAAWSEAEVEVHVRRVLLEA